MQTLDRESGKSLCQLVREMEVGKDLMRRWLEGRGILINHIVLSPLVLLKGFDLRDGRLLGVIFSRLLSFQELLPLFSSQTVTQNLPVPPKRPLAPFLSTRSAFLSFCQRKILSRLVTLLLMALITVQSSMYLVACTKRLSSSQPGAMSLGAGHSVSTLCLSS